MLHIWTYHAYSCLKEAMYKLRDGRWLTCEPLEGSVAPPLLLLACVSAALGAGAGEALVVGVAGTPFPWLLLRNVSPGTTAGGLVDAGAGAASIGPGRVMPSDDERSGSGRSGTAVGETAFPDWAWR